MTLVTAQPAIQVLVLNFKFRRLRNHGWNLLVCSLHNLLSWSLHALLHSVVRYWANDSAPPFLYLACPLDLPYLCLIGLELANDGLDFVRGQLLLAFLGTPQNLKKPWMIPQDLGVVGVQADDLFLVLPKMPLHDLNLLFQVAVGTAHLLDRAVQSEVVLEEGVNHKWVWLGPFAQWGVLCPERLLKLFELGFTQSRPVVLEEEPLNIFVQLQLDSVSLLDPPQLGDKLLHEVAETRLSLMVVSGHQDHSLLLDNLLNFLLNFDDLGEVDPFLNVWKVFLNDKNQAFQVGLSGCALSESL